MPHLLTEAATWLGYEGFRAHLTCKELYEQRPEGPETWMLRLCETESSPGYPGPPGRAFTSFEGCELNRHFLVKWLHAWERALFPIVRLRFGQQCRNLHITRSSVDIICWDGTGLMVTSDNRYRESASIYNRPQGSVTVGIEVTFEELRIERVYYHRDYSWVEVLGTTYRVKWRRPNQQLPFFHNNITHNRRWLEAQIWGDDDFLVFNVSIQPLPRLPAGPGRF